MAETRENKTPDAPHLKDARKNRPIHTIFQPFRRFTKTEASSGIILIISAVLALLWANSPWHSFYEHLLQFPVSVSFGNFIMKEPLEWWINDGLMAIFFLMVGLEIKREILHGELSTFQKASFPIAAAIGGMLLPAVIYSVFNFGGPGAAGWGVSMATDIAFSLGILSLLTRRVSPRLSLFLASLAIVDDIGAVMVIAIFYTGDLNVWALLISAFIFALMLLASYLGARSFGIYIVLGVILWYMIHESGIHATIAGVLMAAAIPDKRIIDSHDFMEDMRHLLGRFAKEGSVGRRIKPSDKQMATVQSMEMECFAVDSPLYRMENALLPIVTYFIIPIFALANAGLHFGPGMGEAFTDPVFIGICAGLLLGKQGGIFGFAWLACKLKIATLPNDVSWKQVYGVSLLGGIGFTMSIFISALAFHDMPHAIETAKLAIILSSLLAGLGGYMVLRSGKGRADTPIADTPV